VFTDQQQLKDETERHCKKAYKVSLYIQFLSLPSKKTTYSKSGQKLLKNSHLATFRNARYLKNSKQCVKFDFGGLVLESLLLVMSFS
jgi:hypothetical protein